MICNWVEEEGIRWTSPTTQNWFEVEDRNCEIVFRYIKFDILSRKLTIIIIINQLTRTDFAAQDIPHGVRQRMDSLKEIERVFVI